MRILLVRPPFARLLHSTVYLTYPLGAMLVAGALRARGHEVMVYHDDVSNPEPIAGRRVNSRMSQDQEIPTSTWETYHRVLDDFEPETVGFGFCTADALAAREMAQATRARGIRTVAGGVHASLLPDEELEFFDCVVTGEGDAPEAARAFEDPSVSFVQAGACEDLDAVQADRQCVIGGCRYSPFLRGMVQTQRGCPYSCSYCAAPTVFGKRVRLRKPEAVREEVQANGITEGRIIDDSFAVVRSHGLAVCRALAGSGFRWRCDAALQNIDRELVEALVSGGCRGVNVGIESASPRWQELSGKRINRDRVGEVASLLDEYGLTMVAYFIIGFPGETCPEVQATLSWASELKSSGVQPCISTLTAYPGTKVWELTEGLRPEQGWDHYFHQSADAGYSALTDEEWNWALLGVDRING